MKKTIMKAAWTLSAFSLVILTSVFARDISPIVSTDWLAKNLKEPRLIIMDIRKVEEYREGHIPYSINVPYVTWAETHERLNTEIPSAADLFEAMGSAGIRNHSLIVVVCRMDVCQTQVEAARVFCTLEYGGLENVGILDGGYEQWVREKRPITTKVVKPGKTVYKGKLNKSLIADKDYVSSRLGKAVFVDVRERELFLGTTRQSFVKKYGHIPGAINLPVTEAFTKRGTFKSKEELESIAAKTVGTDKSNDIVTYCDAGKCCPTWAFILREVLGYKNVRIYDGSFEEWSREINMPVTR